MSSGFDAIATVLFQAMFTGVCLWIALGAWSGPQVALMGPGSLRSTDAPLHARCGIVWPRLGGVAYRVKVVGEVGSADGTIHDNNVRRSDHSVTLDASRDSASFRTTAGHTPGFADSAPPRPSADRSLQ